MKSICGMDCCDKCSRKNDCGGCLKNNGHPFGGECIAAKYIENEGEEGFIKFKNTLIDEINSLGIKGLQVNDLNLLNGFYVNLEYKLKNGQTIKFLEDNNIYLGNQIKIPGNERCYGIIADENNLLVCTYGCNGDNPEIVLYKKR